MTYAVKKDHYKINSFLCNCFVLPSFEVTTLIITTMPFAYGFQNMSSCICNDFAILGYVTCYSTGCLNMVICAGLRFQIKSAIGKTVTRDG